jgi:hypothetical protein
MSFDKDEYESDFRQLQGNFFLTIYRELSLLRAPNSRSIVQSDSCSHATSLLLLLRIIVLFFNKRGASIHHAVTMINTE